MVLLRRIKYYLGRALIKQESRDELHTYWRSPQDGSNKPEDYILGRDGEAPKRTGYIVDLIESESSKDESILEIGCNVGRNLNELYIKGFRNLSAIDISEEALTMLINTYPELASIANLYNTPVEESIIKFRDCEFDVVFTMAVLMHIHPDSEFIFDDMVRITKKRLIVIEDEECISSRHFPRNYKKVFERLKMTQIFSETNVPGSSGVCRVFRHTV